MTPSPPAQDNPWGGESSWHPSFHHAMTCHDLLYHEYVQYVLIKQVYTIYKYGVHILFVICLHELQLVKCFTVSLFYFFIFQESFNQTRTRHHVLQISNKIRFLFFCIFPVTHETSFSFLVQDWQHWFFGRRHHLSAERGESIMTDGEFRKIRALDGIIRPTNTCS